MTNAEPVAEIKYEVSPEDVVALRLFFANEATDGRRRRRGRLWSAGLASLTTLGVTAAALDWNYRPDKNLIVPVIAAPPVLTAFFGIAAYLAFRESPTGVRRQVRDEIARTDRLRHVLGPKRLVVTADGYRVFGDGLENYYAWRIVPKVLRSFDHLYLCESFSPKRMSAVVVPGRGFESLAAFDDFCRLVEVAWRGAQVEAALRE